MKSYKGKLDKHIFVIGGREIYQQTYTDADYYYVSVVKGTYEGNVYFPFLNWREDGKHKNYSLEKLFKSCKLIKKEEFLDFIAYIYKNKIS